jgi:hypothetical protein
MIRPTFATCFAIVRMPASKTVTPPPFSSMK